MAEEIIAAAPAAKPAGGPPAGGPPAGGPSAGGPPKRKPKQNIGLIVGLIVGIIFWFVPLPGLPEAGSHWLGLTLCAVIWWAMQALPAPITGGIYVGFAVLFGVFLGQDGALYGKDIFGAWFEGSNCWITIAAMLIAAGVENTGLGRRIALAVCSLKFIKGFSSLVYAIAILHIVTALIIPSAFARTFLILAVVEEICIANNLGETDTRNLKFTSFVLAMPTMTVFLTAEAAINGIVASALGGVSFAGWFVQIGIPSLIMCAIAAFVFTIVFKPKEPIVINTDVCREDLASLGGLKKGEWKMVCWLVVLLIFWFAAGKFNLQLNVGTFFFAALMFIPYIGVLKMPDLEKISLGTLLFVTVTVAVGNVARSSGFADWLGNLLAGILPASVANTGILAVLFIAIVCIIVHLLVCSVMATTAVMVPILVALAPAIPALSPSVILYVGFMMISCSFLLPVHQAPLATGQAKGGFTDQMVTKFGAPLLVVLLVMSIVVLGWTTLIGA